MRQISLAVLAALACLTLSACAGFYVAGDIGKRDLAPERTP